MILDRIGVDESSIRIRFNNLCHQFENNTKYLSPNSQTIANDEDISYNINVHNKRYEAVFYQKSIHLDNANTSYDLYNHYLDESFKKPVWFMISEYLGKYHIAMFYENGYNKSNGEDL